MRATWNNMQEAGIHKAAIVVASLDPAAADRLLERLPQQWAGRVRQAVMALEGIDAQEQQRVIEEFRRIGPMIPDRCPPGIELDGLAAPAGQTFLSAVAQPAVARTCLSATGRQEACRPSDAPPFGFLCEAEEEKLSQLLGGERPQTVALVLSHLPPAAGRRGVGAFRAAAASRGRPSPAGPGKRRPGNPARGGASVGDAVGPAVRHRAQPHGRAENRGANPGGLSEPTSWAAFWTTWRSSIQALAEQLGRRPMEFDDLAQLDDATLWAVFRAAEPEVALLALLGTPPPLVERILAGMSARKEKSLRRKLDCPGPIRLSDVEEARREIAALAQRMSHSSPVRDTWRRENGMHRQALSRDLMHATDL